MGTGDVRAEYGVWSPRACGRPTWRVLIPEPLAWPEHRLTPKMPVVLGATQGVHVCEEDAGAPPPDGLGPTGNDSEEWVCTLAPGCGPPGRPGRRVPGAGQGVGLRFPASLPSSVLTGFL